MKNGFIDWMKIIKYNNSQLLEYSFFKLDVDPNLFEKLEKTITYRDIYNNTLFLFFSYLGHIPVLKQLQKLVTI